LPKFLYWNLADIPLDGVNMVFLLS